MKKRKLAAALAFMLTVTSIPVSGLSVSAAEADVFSDGIEIAEVETFAEEEVPVMEEEPEISVVAEELPATEEVPAADEFMEEEIPLFTDAEVQEEIPVFTDAEAFEVTAEEGAAEITGESVKTLADYETILADQTYSLTQISNKKFVFVPEITGAYILEMESTEYMEYYFHDAECEMIDEWDEGEIFKNRMELEEGVQYFFTVSSYETDYTDITFQFKYSDFDIANNQSVKVAYGKSITLDTEATSGAGIQNYIWEKCDWDSDEWVNIGNDGKATYTIDAVTERAEYLCRVTDGNGDTLVVQFNVSVDSGLSIDWANTDNETKRVVAGGSVTLEMFVNANEGVDVTFEWVDDNEDPVSGAVSGEKSSSLTLNSLSASEYFYCRAKDAYGNSVTVDFYVELTAGIELEYTREYTVKPGESATLEVKATTADGSELEYLWYGYSWETGEGGRIDGATGSTYVVSGITERMDYECVIIDKYGCEEYAYMEVMVDSGLDTQEEYYYYEVNPGKSIELKTDVSAYEGVELFYTWSVSKDGEWSIISGETDSSYVVENISSTTEFYCRVVDSYGNEKTIYFVVELEPTWTAKYAISGTNIKVEYGKDITLTCEVENPENEKLTYEWVKFTSTEGNVSLGVNTPSYTVKNVTSQEIYRCFITDQYGCSTSVPFSIFIDSGLKVDYSQMETNVRVAKKGDSAELKVYATANPGVEINYQWYTMSFTPIDGAILDTYTVPYVDGSYYYRCLVSDQYGWEEWINFHVNIDSGLKVEYKEDVPVKKGDSVTLTVNASVNEGYKIDSYYWYGPDGQRIENVSGNTVTLTNIQKSGYYICEVVDDIENNETCPIYVHIDTGLEIDHVNLKNRVQAAAGEKVNLHLPILVDEGIGVTYQWFDKNRNPISGATNATYPITATGKYEAYYCTATDECNGSVTTGFTVNGVSTSTQGELVVVEVEAGKSATLKAEATVGEGGKLTYEWYKYDTGDIREDIRLTETTGDTLVIDPVTDFGMYYCLVGDGCTAEVCYFKLEEKTETVWAAPVMKSAAGLSGKRIKVEWNADENAEGYIVYRKTKGGNDDWAELGKVAKKETSFIDATPKAGVNYTYAVRAYAGDKLSALSEGKTTVAKTAAPVLEGAEAVAYNKITVTWKSVEQATGYRIYRKADGETKWTMLTDVAANVKTYTDSTVKAGTRYYYTVKSYCQPTGKKFLGQCSSKGVWAVTRAQAPVHSSTTATAYNKITFKWNKVAGVDGYLVYRKTEDGKWKELKYVTADKNSVVDTVESGVKYSYTVKGYNIYKPTGKKLLGYCYSKGKDTVTRAQAPKHASVEAATGKITFKWNKVAGVDGYLVYRKEAGGEWKALKYVSNTTTSYTDTSVKAGKTYEYTVKGYDIYKTTGKKLLGYCYKNGEPVTAK